jgi:ABC-type lipoprotein release transport system permease subunit
MTGWIEKQRTMVDFTLSSLWRRKARNLSLITVYTLVVFVFASTMFFSHALKREAALILKDMPEMVVQKVVAGRHALIPTSYASRLSGIRGVTSAEPRLWGYYFFPSIKANYTVMAPEAFKHPKGNAIVGPGVARAHGLKKGDAIGFKAADGSPIQFTIAGILPVESELVSADLILVSKADFRQLFDIPEGYATDLALSVRNQRELPTIAAKIVEMLPDARPIMRDEMLRTYEAVFDWRHGLLIAVLLGGLLSFGILAWDKASGLSAEERKEIGILKAIGWETSDVILVKFWEGTVISLTSFLAGILFAYIHVFFSSAVLFESVLKGWSVLYPRFRLTPFVSPYQVITLFFLVVVPYTVATIIPSWKAATVDPDEQVR